MKLIPDEEKLYDRHLKLEQVGMEGQLKLKQSKVVVVGAGGLGCAILSSLVAAGVGEIGIVDFDKVEISNLQRQHLYSLDDIGKYKTTQAIHHLKQKNPFVKFTAFNEKLNTKNAIELFQKFDLVIDGTDNFETRYLINDACVLSGKTLIYGAIDKFAGHVSVFNAPFGATSRSATYRCVFPSAPLPESVQNCESNGVLGVMPSIIGTLQATEAIKFITGLGTTLANKLLTVDALHMTFNSISISRNEKLWSNFPASVKEFEEFDYPTFCGILKNEELIPSITFNEMEQLISNNASIQIIDIRMPHEEPQLNFPQIQKIPMSEIAQRISDIRKDIPVVIFCASGFRSRQIIRKLQTDYQLKNVFHLEGGLASMNPV